MRCTDGAAALAWDRLGTTIKPAPLLAAFAAALVIAAPSAGAVATTAATPSAGVFTGTTSQSHPISFTVSRTHRSIGRKRTTLALTCPDGYTSTFTISKPIPVSIHRGTFKRSWTGTSGLGAPYRIQFAGRFARKKRAAGTIQITVTYPSHGACSSGAVSWSARHR